MQTQSNGLAEAPHMNPRPDERVDEFGHSDPIVIGARLRNLVNGSDFLTVQYAGGQLVTQLLDVEAQMRTFTIDWGAATTQNRGLLGAPHCRFSAEPDGVRVEFATGSPRETRFEGLPAFEFDFPEVLSYRQRREHFRIEAPVLSAYSCTGSPPEGGKTFHFDVHDLSLGGVSIRTTDDSVADWPIGICLRNCELSLGTFGRFLVDLELISHRPTVQPNGVRRHRMGLRFVALPGKVEGKLQRLITHLELRRYALTR
jgi:c-di-GMP-binding flagellar brake protein YcgR